jgi:hypothetical protein
MTEEKEIWIFLSHSNKDFAKVRMIRNYLEERSCRPLMFFLKCLSNDDEIDGLIKREIDCRTRFIICESENSRGSKWVQSEVKYIKSQQRAYETIDLSQTDEQIKAQLDELVKSTQIFLAYSRRDDEIVRSVYSHIRKYDIKCMGVDPDFISGKNFQEAFSNDIDLAREFGFVVFFASRNSMSGLYFIEELMDAAEKGASILVLLMDDFAKANYKELFTQAQDIPVDDLVDRSNAKIKVRDLTVAKTQEEMIELAVEKIVDRAFAPWTTYTMAKNLLDGIDCPKDPEEAQRLFRIAYRKSDALDTIGYPGGTLFVARCMANGYGTEKDLRGALCYYQDYIRTCGSNDRIDAEMEAIRRELGEK